MAKIYCIQTPNWVRVNVYRFSWLRLELNLNLNPSQRKTLNCWLKRTHFFFCTRKTRLKCGYFVHFILTRLTIKGNRNGMFSTHGQRRKLCKKFFASCQRIQFDESKCWIYSTGSTKIPFFSLIQNSHCFHIYMYIILYTPRAFLRRRGAHMPRQVATEI